MKTTAGAVRQHPIHQAKVAHDAHVNQPDHAVSNVCRFLLPARLHHEMLLRWACSPTDAAAASAGMASGRAAPEPEAASAWTAHHCALVPVHQKGRKWVSHTPDLYVPLKSNACSTRFVTLVHEQGVLKDITGASNTAVSDGVTRRSNSTKAGE